MKSTVLIICFLFLKLQVIAQEIKQVDEDDKVYSFVQRTAEPRNGMMNFLQNFSNEFNSLVIPPKQDEISFKLKFIVEKNGSFSNVEIIDNQEAYPYYEEIIRVLKKTSFWKPAENNNKIVRSYHVIPIKLRFPMRNVDKVLLEKAILERTISNEYFDFECNCKLINKSTNGYYKVKEFSYNTPHSDIFYSISLKEIDLNDLNHYFDVIKIDANKKNAAIKEVTYKGFKALETEFVINNKENSYYNYTLSYAANNYLIKINVISTNKQVSKYNFEDLKQTFRLKI
ncbi:hypothetical protein H1R17_06520 [Flavobacterium sp. xlx-214]|uniref:energy transducer TonB n=1 Tax=unclassified Flavobacterium TaxID=196869 RepID=UPI0013D7C5E5|nr:MULTISPECIES: hypothetical protein [unclassified Flavobacterium]MBA5792896.1 hypothetical protein [Flavobacterium sp. xlx-221]QMI84770.1 hypothetical protein H1R17_06520 [Flavobacterium sp. xlx-214]